MRVLKNLAKKLDLLQEQFFALLAKERVSKLFAERISELGNLLFITLVASQLLSDQVNVWLLAIGFLAYFSCYFLSYIIITQKEKV